VFEIKSQLLKFMVDSRMLLNTGRESWWLIYSTYTLEVLGCSTRPDSELQELAISALSQELQELFLVSDLRSFISRDSVLSCNLGHGQSAAVSCFFRYQSLQAFSLQERILSTEVQYLFPSHPGSSESSREASMI